MVDAVPVVDARLPHTVREQVVRRLHLTLDQTPTEIRLQVSLPTVEVDVKAAQSVDVAVAHRALRARDPVPRPREVSEDRAWRRGVSGARNDAGLFREDR